MKKQLLTLATLVFLSGIQALAADVDTSMSLLKWHGHKALGGGHTGTLKVKNGALTFVKGELSQGTLVIDMNSINDDDLAKDPEHQAKLITHLKSDDFFNVEKYPTAQFVIQSVKALKKPTKDGLTNEVSGQLTIRDKTHPFSFKANLMNHGPLFHATAKLSINRVHYDVKFASISVFKSIADKAIDDDFEVELDIYAKLSADELKK